MGDPQFRFSWFCCPKCGDVWREYAHRVGEPCHYMCYGPSTGEQHDPQFGYCVNRAASKRPRRATRARYHALAILFDNSGE